MYLFRMFAVAAALCFAMPFSSFADGWKQQNDKWYYEENGALKTGWLNEFGYSYHFNENGVMDVGNICIDGINYELNESMDGEIPYGALINNETVRLKKHFSNDLRYLTAENSECKKDRVLIFLHGLGGKAEDNIGYAEEMASYGYFVIAPDAYAHGISEGEADYADIIVRSSQNIDRCLDECGISKDADVSVMGVSMGGMIGSYYSVNGERHVNRLSMIISTPDFESLCNDMFFKIYKNGIVVGEADKNTVKEKLSAISPMNELYHSSTNCLIISSPGDDVIPEFIPKNCVNVNSVLMDEYGHTTNAGYFHKAMDFVKTKKAGN